MSLEEDKFILGLASDFWATVYKKRKQAATGSIIFFDLAAQINQISAHFGDQDHQDQVIKKHFRNFVDHVIKVI